MSSGRKFILIQQPRLLGYRKEEFRKLQEKCDIGIFYSAPPNLEGHISQIDNYLPGAEMFLAKEISFLKGRLTWQLGILAALLKHKPDIFFVQANVRYISFWLSLFFCKALGVTLISHGQGLYRFPVPGKIRSLIYRFHIALADKYVCYNELSKASLLSVGAPAEKLLVANNSLINTYQVRPEEKTGSELGVLFVGRLRERSGLIELIEAVRLARIISLKNITLHIIGGGEQEDLITTYVFGLDWVKLYGSLYDDFSISAVSKDCFLGVYPGDAGLSIVHYMSMSLPPIVHGQIHSHMGPEPSYIVDGKNGILFDKSDPINSMAKAISALAMDMDKLRRAQSQAFNTYLQLTNPSLGDRLAAIFLAV